MGNIGFGNEIDMAGLEGFPGIKVENIKPQEDASSFLTDMVSLSLLQAAC